MEITRDYSTRDQKFVWKISVPWEEMNDIYVSAQNEFASKDIPVSEIFSRLAHLAQTIEERHREK